MPGVTLPPFPDDVPTHPLLIVDYNLITAGDADEVEKLWNAAKELGFWYLKNHHAEQEVDDMFDLAATFMGAPVKEKLKYEQGDNGSSPGYKALGAAAIDEYGTPDTVESLNIAKDDALSYPIVTHRTYPSVINESMESTVKPFVRKSVEVNNTILGIFEEKLGLPDGALLQRHNIDGLSGSEARVSMTPSCRSTGESRIKDTKVALGAHTDFGSLSVLHNRLGGLQVLPPGYEAWQYIRPLPGHAICNIGDALTLLSGGILRSNLHRVVPPPGEQGLHDRYSLVFFTRPGNDVMLRALVDESNRIRDVVNSLPEGEKAKYEPNSTAGDWFARRVKLRRLKNRKGPETWLASRGMEHKRPEELSQLAVGA